MYDTNSHSLEQKLKCLFFFLLGHTVQFMLHHTFARASASLCFVLVVKANSGCPLGALHLFADLVAEDLVPVDLGAGDGKLSA